MSRLVLVLFGALLALLSLVQAKDEIIRLYTFTADNCFGAPQLGNVDLKRGKCHNIPAGARSIKPFIHKNLQWLQDINSGGTQCEVIAYTGAGCLDGQELAFADLPGDIQECITPRNDLPIHSVNFQCGVKRSGLEEIDRTYTRTRTMVATSWFVGSDDKPTPTRSTTTVTLTHYDDGGLAARSPEPEIDHLQPRDDKVRKGVWMFHPWSRSVICYDCYSGHSNFDKFECRSGPRNPADCGPRPLDENDQPETITVSSGRVTTSYLSTSTPVTTQTLTGFTSISPGNDTELEKRSWHRRVTFRHPSRNDQVCADAEWEKRGQSGSEIRLQKPGTDMKKCRKADDLVNLDLPPPVTETVRYTSTVISSFTEASTSTTYVLDSASDDNLTTVTSSTTSTIVTTQTQSMTVVTSMTTSTMTSTSVETTFTPVIAHADL